MSDDVRLLRDAMRNILGELTVRTMQEGSKPSRPVCACVIDLLVSDVAHDLVGDGEQKTGIEGERSETERQHSTLRNFWLSITKFKFYL